MRHQFHTTASFVSFSLFLLLILIILTILSFVHSATLPATLNFTGCYHHFYKNTPPLPRRENCTNETCTDMCHQGFFATLQNLNLRAPEYSAYYITYEQAWQALANDFPRPAWKYSGAISEMEQYPITNFLWSGSSGDYDKGHLTPKESMDYNKDAVGASMDLTNVIPQLDGCNQRTWVQLEKDIRYWVRGKNQSLHVVVAVGYKDYAKPNWTESIVVPDYMITAICDPNATESVAFVGIPNQEECGGILYEYHTVREIETKYLNGTRIFHDDCRPCHLNNSHWFGYFSNDYTHGNSTPELCMGEETSTTSTTLMVTSSSTTTATTTTTVTSSTSPAPTTTTAIDLTTTTTATSSEPNTTTTTTTNLIETSFTTTTATETTINMSATTSFVSAAASSSVTTNTIVDASTTANETATTIDEISSTTSALAPSSSTTTTIMTTTNPSNNSGAAAENDDTSLSTGEAVGVTFGVLIFVSIIAITAFKCAQTKKKKSRQFNEASAVDLDLYLATTEIAREQHYFHLQQQPNNTQQYQVQPFQDVSGSNMMNRMRGRSTNRGPDLTQL